MKVLEHAIYAFQLLCKEENVDLSEKITIEPIKPEKLFAEDLDSDLAIMQGKEHIIQANFKRSHGHVFTPTPDEWTGSVEDVINIDISDVKGRSIAAASINAVMRSLQDVQCTEHCLGKGPIHCGTEIASRMDIWFSKKKYLVIGFQPILIKNLVETFGADNVKTLDLQEYYIGNSRYNSEILHGIENLEPLIEWSDVGLASGVSLVNDTIDAIRDGFKSARKPVIFFGTTISGVAVLTGLQRICPYGH